MFWKVPDCSGRQPETPRSPTLGLATSSGCSVARLQGASLRLLMLTQAEVDG